ncbi:hypothetical protein WOC76_23220 [Methylocystis sp. IM3]|uniref:hypothetical protein n=1 Tax=unclassified Methylocystis TaxID=2625913 RepID=UPI0030F51578
MSLPSGDALAKGCIKGAIAGGILGHYAGRHGMLGAIAGSLYGRHEAKKLFYYGQRREPSRGWL